MPKHVGDSKPRYANTAAASARCNPLSPCPERASIWGCIVKLTIQPSQQAHIDNRVFTTQVLRKRSLVVVTPHPLPDPSSWRLLRDKKAGLLISSSTSWSKGERWAHPACTVPALAVLGCAGHFPAYPKHLSVLEASGRARQDLALLGPALGSVIAVIGPEVVRGRNGL